MTSRGAKYWDSGAIPLIAPDILGDIIAQIADIALVISQTGTILSVLTNPSDGSFEPLEQWEGRDIRSTMTSESLSKFDSRLAAFLADQGPVRQIELNHTDAGLRWDIPVRYSFHQIGPDGAVLLLGRDLRPVAQMQQQLVDAQLALERDYETQREFDTRFRVLMESLEEAVLFISVATGTITEANSAATVLLDRPLVNLVGQQLSHCFEGKSRSDLTDALASHAITDHNKQMPATLRDSGTQVQLVPTLFRAAGDRILLCRILRDDQPLQQDGDLPDHLLAVYRDGPEPMVFTTHGGNILSANDAFLDMIDVAHDINLRDRSLADYLQRGSVDLKVMTENATRSGRMRSYATKLAGEYGSPRAVDISIVRIAAGAQTVFAFVLRDATLIDKGPARGPAPADDNMRSVVELVGSATLKDIVAETTNVVEKMCIETAVELTMNNRVAAAEMLGLSRQSLYVKLRKFNLLERDSDDRT